MDPNLLRAVSCWLVVFYSASVAAESRLVDSRRFGASDPRGPLPVAHGEVQPRLSAAKLQESAELGVRPRPVSVKCHPDSMEVVVQADMFDAGLEVEGGHLRLGLEPLSGCGAVPSGAEEFTILARLTDCGTTLSSTEEKIIYSNVLFYSPEPSVSSGLLRLDEAAIPVECHYEKRYSVAGISLLPAWVPFVSITSADDQIDFNLRIMTDDWQFERGSHTFFLGDPIHFEVSVVLGNHMALRVYADRCVAAATPDADSIIRYDFIENHGCLVDAYLTNSISRFLPRAEEHKLRFQLEAFKFYQEPSNQIYITCLVKAVPVMLAVSSENRACSLIKNRWQSVDGSNQVCRSCDTSQQFEEPQTTEPPRVIPSTETWPAKTSQERLAESKAEHPAATFVSFRPGMHIKPQSSAKFMKRDADQKDQKTIHMGPIIVLPAKNTKATESKAALSDKNETS
ncbi:zona pellucida sperm-binding protein 3 [Kryptolebias marmoratus]|uniref:Zona pellucida sperm-binding protein 3 n=1 Tax=Kryptolebias marmoratus TaxID=37003 RepID=A0A3Q3AQZ4_KRYMA|nr:zona pellucida sperm-binding protein 3 [Kryptolebias marmoratus]